MRKPRVFPLILLSVVLVPSVVLSQEPESFVLDPQVYTERVDVEEERPDAVFQLDVALPPVGQTLGEVPMIAPSGEWVYTRQDVTPLAYQFSYRRFYGGLGAVAAGGWLIWNDLRGPTSFQWSRSGPAVVSAIFGLWQMHQARRVLRLPVDAVVEPGGVEFQRVFEW